VIVRAARHVAEATAAPPGRREFRREIQALRGLAVAGVVLFHLWPAALPGGFVGVDVFFVISGFLITQQLVDEAAVTGRISLTRFWARRIRRILPAAFTVLLACVAGVLLLLPRVTWLDNLADIRAAAAYAENWQLAARAVDYLAAESNPSLVQHYWSLSVEEQFYLAWPLLILLAIAVARRLPGRSPRAWPVAVLSVAGLASFVLSVTWTSSDPSTAFFATPTRAWEFALGGLAGALITSTATPRTDTIRRLTSFAGLLLVLVAMVRITADDPFPGVIALVPAAGATLVVAAEVPTHSAGFLARLAGSRPVQWVGDASYSIYLWHWPLVVAAPWVLHRQLSTSDRLAVLAASLVLAALTKRLVEDPVHTGTWWRSRAWRTYALPVAGVTVLLITSSTISARVTVAETKAAAAAREDAVRQTQALVADPPKSTRASRGQRPRSCYGAAAMDPANKCSHPYARPRNVDTAFAATDGNTDACLQKYDAAAPAICTLGRTRNPSRTVAIVGNSHAWRLVPALTLYGEQHGWRILVATRINCLGLMTTSVAAAGASQNCLSWSAAVQRRLLSMPHLDAVVFPSYSYTDKFTVGQHATQRQIRERRDQVLSLWSAFAAHGSRVVVTDDVPGMRPTSDPECIARSNDDDPCTVDRQSVVLANPVVDLARSYPRLATHVPLTQYFCDAKRCHALIGGVVVYFDSHHLTTTYSRSLARYLGDAISAAMPPRRR
jgi:peptidoglycan/LPS O-acetylase OafA/YrhL